MNKILNISIIIALLCFGFISCDTDVEAEDMYHLEVKSPEYYENLRAFKATMFERQISFGWFGGWTAVGPSYSSYLNSIPDSMDVVSLWSGFTGSNEQRMDLEYVKKTKGTKFLHCMIISDLGRGYTPRDVEIQGQDAIKEYWGWVDGDEELIEGSIRKYAKTIAEDILGAGLDGFDIDYEEFDGTITRSVQYTVFFIDELSKYFGPQSGTDKILVIDGYVNQVPKEIVHYFDWLVIQAYYCSSDNILDGGQSNRFKDAVNRFAGVLTPEQVAQKVIMTEDFEMGGYAPNGGREFTRRDGTKTTSLLGMAMWEPYYNGKLNIPYKGGCGTYHMEYEYKNTPQYKWLREAIQIMNPAKK